MRHGAVDLPTLYLSLSVCRSLSVSVCLSFLVQGLFKGLKRNRPPCHEKIRCAGLFVFIPHARVQRARTRLSKCKFKRETKMAILPYLARSYLECLFKKIHLELFLSAKYIKVNLL